LKGNDASLFAVRTEDSSALQYFQVRDPSVYRCWCLSHFIYLGVLLICACANSIKCGFVLLQFYGYLSQQQNMMQDYIRTATYQEAILANTKDFQDKVILDVGAGSGILSFFAIQAGAKKVYAVEASSMAIHAEVIGNGVKSNSLFNWKKLD